MTMGELETLTTRRDEARKNLCWARQEGARMATVLERTARALRGESVSWGENYAGMYLGPAVSFHDAAESMFPSADDVLEVLKTYIDTAEILREFDAAVK